MVCITSIRCHCITELRYALPQHSFMSFILHKTITKIPSIIQSFIDFSIDSKFSQLYTTFNSTHNNCTWVIILYETQNTTSTFQMHSIPCRTHQHFIHTSLFHHYMSFNHILSCSIHSTYSHSFHFVHTTFHISFNINSPHSIMSYFTSTFLTFIAHTYMS